MPQAVYVIWTILLVIVVLSLPLVVSLLHRTFRAARSIERYLKEMKVAGLGIAENTGNIEALNSTIETAGSILKTAGEIDAHAGTIQTTVAARADELDTKSHQN